MNSRAIIQVLTVKPPGLTCTHNYMHKSSIMASVQIREEEGACIPEPVGQPRLFRATGSLCKPHLFSWPSPFVAKLPAGAHGLAVSSGVFHAKKVGENPPTNHSTHRLAVSNRNRRARSHKHRYWPSL